MTHLEHASERAAFAPWRAALVVSAATFACFFAVADPAFQVNDDVGIMNAVNGLAWGAPEPHTIYLNAMLSWPLAWLYTVTPDIPWYGLLVYLTHFLVTTAWLALLFQRRRTSLEMLLALGVLLFFQVGMLLEVTYSAAALAVGGLGVILHFEALPDRLGGLRSSLVAGVMIGLSWLLRQDVFPALAMVALPSLVWRARGIAPSRHAAVVAVCAALAATGGVVHTAMYADDDWVRFREHFDLRFALHGTPRLAQRDATTALAAGVGWSENDLALFKSYVYPDVEVYDVESLAALVDATEGVAHARSPVRALHRRVLRRYPAQCFAVALFAAIVVPRLRGPDRWMALAILGLSFGGVLYLATFLRVPPRLAEPLALTVLAWLTIAPGARPLTERRPDGARVTEAIALACIVAVASMQVVRVSAAHAVERAALLDTLESASRLAHDPIVIFLGAGLAWEKSSPFSARGDFPPIRYVPLGWSTQSPTFQHHLERLGIDDVYLAPTLRDDVFVAGRLDVIERFERWNLEHHGRAPSLEPKLSYGEDRAIYGRRSAPDE